MKKFGIIVGSFVLPLSALAAITDINSIFTFIKGVLNTVLPLIIALAVVVFVWGIFQYVVAADEEKKKEAQSKIIYGVVGLFVMVSVWGLVNILVNTFGITNSTPETLQNQLPNLPTT